MNFNFTPAKQFQAPCWRWSCWRNELHHCRRYYRLDQDPPSRNNFIRYNLSYDYWLRIHLKVFWAEMIFKWYWRIQKQFLAFLALCSFHYSSCDLDISPQNSRWIFMYQHFSGGWWMGKSNKKPDKLLDVETPSRLQRICAENIQFQFGSGPVLASTVPLSGRYLKFMGVSQWIQTMRHSTLPCPRHHVTKHHADGQQKETGDASILSAHSISRFPRHANKGTNKEQRASFSQNYNEGKSIHNTVLHISFDKKLFVIHNTGELFVIWISLACRGHVSLGVL